MYDIDTAEKLREVLNSVFEKIEICCRKQIEFARNYIEKYNLNKAKYLAMPFHPRTRYGNPQLHIERVMFSHMEYFNRCRMYLLSNGVSVKYDEFNNILLEYIGKYLTLYEKYILQICADRNGIASKMKKKLDNAYDGKMDISIEV